MGERYFELSLTPGLSLIGGVECHRFDFTACSDAFELVCQVDGLHLLPFRVGVIAINREMALFGNSAVVNCHRLIGINVHTEQCCSEDRKYFLHNLNVVWRCSR